MRRKTNIGVSMVEILISIAIFAILMVPIVSGIVSSLKSSTESKTLQYRNEFAENIMEYVKQDSLINILEGEYFSSVGSYTDGGDSVTSSATFYKDPTKFSYDESLKELADSLTSNGVSLTVDNTDVMSEDQIENVKTYYPYESYTISGKVNLGTKHDTYSYVMEISNEYYAQKEMDTLGSYHNPNNLALGIVEDIDHTKVALINGTIANYDSAVTNAFTTKKIETLKVIDPDWYEIYTQQQTGVDIFGVDTATRVITVKVSGSAEDGYKVKCNLKYHDNCESNVNLRNALSDYYIEYSPFEFNYEVDEATGYATLPNIYLMYNVCLYNGQFVSDDYIAIDTSEVDDDTKVNVFIVETAETYSSDVVEANEDLVTVDDSGNVVSRPTLYNKNVQSGAETRDGVDIHIAAAKGSELTNLSIYHNFDCVKNEDYNLKNSNILYTSNDVFDTKFTRANYIPLVQYGYVNGVAGILPSSSVANFESLDGAQQESRGLYEVKIWIQKGDTVDTTVNPTLTGTKGGDES